jgi:hypothetical protein
MKMRARTIGLHEQAAFMRFWWPTFTTRVRRGTLVTEGEVCPDELCATYRVQVTYAGGGTPEVRVLSPELCPRAGEDRIPHMYEQERLCLYLPSSGQWSAEKPIAVTLVPWASLWLYFYEVWHATGEWLGGGMEPEAKPPIRREVEHYERPRKAR